MGGERESCIVRTRSRWKILSTYCPESGKRVWSWSVDKWSLSIVLETCKPSEFRIMVFKGIRSYSLEPVNVALYGKRVLADMINLRILRWDYLDLCPKCNQKCPCKKEVEADSTQKLQGARSKFSPRASGGSPALLTPWFGIIQTDFWVLTSRNVGG